LDCDVACRGRSVVKQLCGYCFGSEWVLE